MDVNQDFYIFKEKFGRKRDNTYLCTEFRTSIRACDKKEEAKKRYEKEQSEHICCFVDVMCDVWHFTE